MPPGCLCHTQLLHTNAMCWMLPSELSAPAVVLFCHLLTSWGLDFSAVLGGGYLEAGRGEEGDPRRFNATAGIPCFIGWGQHISSLLFFVLLICHNNE